MINNSKSDKYSLFFLITLLILIITSIFSATFSFDFINFDDNVFVINNPNVNTGVTSNNLFWAFTSIYAGQYQPITWISHMLDVQIYGMNGGKHHITNVVIHCFSTIIFFLILSKLGLKNVYSFLLALLWGIHPMRLESVAWIAERKDLLSIFFGLLTTYTYINYQSKFKYLFVIIFFTLGLMSKPIIITLPILLLLIDYFFLQKDLRNYKNLLSKIPLFILMLISAYITVYGQKQDSSLSSLNTVPIDDRITMIATSYLAYLGKLFYPAGGALFYPAVDLPNGIGTGALIGFIAIIIFALRNKFLSFAVFWFVVSLLPVIGIIHVGGQSLADRWTYFSHLGLIIGIGFYLQDNTKYQKIIIPTLLIIILGFSYITFNRLPNWKDSKAIFQYTLKVSPNNFMAHTNLGVAYDNENQLDLAAPHFEEAARLNPSYPEALNNLGSLRARQGRMQEAATLFQKALKIRPEFESARRNLNLIYSKYKN